MEMRASVAEVLNRWSTAGLAVGVVSDGSLAWFHGHGVADIASSTPVDEDTVFRIASITKTMTAIAVMQLWEQGLVGLDAPASDYLRGHRLVPAKADFGPATVRHLLTHTAGVRAVRTPLDLLRPALGWGARVGEPAPSLSEYYRGGLRVDVEPGTKWAYSNHGFATLGQLVEDVSGLPFDRYLREHVFGPLGMENSDLLRSERVRSRVATGYALGSGGLKAVANREVVTAGAGGVYSTTRDMARYVAALLGGGTGKHGSVLKRETLALMFEPHYQPDPRIPGMGLAFFRDQLGGHRTVGHDGIWNGFRTDMVLVPDEGIGVLSFANTGGFDPVVRRCRSRTRCCATSSASAMTSCAPMSRSTRRYGVTCAAFTRSVLDRSLIPSPGWRLGRGSKLPFVASGSSCGAKSNPSGAQGASPPPRAGRSLCLSPRSVGSQAGHLARGFRPWSGRR